MTLPPWMTGLTSKIITMREIARHPLNRGAPVSALMRYLAWNLGHRILATDFVMPLVGEARIILSREENYATLAYTEQLWDYEEMGFLLHLLREGDLFVDIGANVGSYTVLASKVAGAHSLAVEPVPATYAKLCRNLRLNDIAGQVEALNIGLADAPGELRFTASLGGLNHVVADGAAESVVVPVMTLDAALAGRHPVMLKMDVEGYEMHVMRGGEACFRDPALKAVVLELNGSSGRYGFSDDALHARMLDFGFAPHAYDPAARRLSPLPTYRSEGMNTLYCRPGDGLFAARLASAPRLVVRGHTL